MKTRKAITVLVLVFVIFFMYTTVQSAVVLSDENYAYLSDYKWYKSLDRGMSIAEQENKPVFVYFWAVWCQFCEKFETQTLTDPRIKEILENDFVMVAVDLDEDRGVARKYGVSYPPHELFVDEQGRVLNRVGGYVDADYFYQVLQMTKADFHSRNGGQ